MSHNLVRWANQHPGDHRPFWWRHGHPTRSITFLLAIYCILVICPPPKKLSLKTGIDLGDTAIVLGLIGFIFAFIPFLRILGIVVAAVGLILGIITVRRKKPKSDRMTPPAVAVVLSVVALIVGTAMTSTTSETPKPVADTSAISESLSPKPTDTAPDAPTAVEASDFKPTVSAPVTADITALALLKTLPVKGNAPKTGYDRVGNFGAPWTDIDHNGCDTRNDILARDLEPEAKNGECTVTSGTLNDPYTGKTIQFVRGETTSLAVQIDHVVPLLNAWQSGAQQLTQAQRVTLANDPINLFAVDGPTNAQKGAGNAATWLPPNKTFRCTYVARQVSVKATYGLWVTQAERDESEKILTGCPDEKATPSAFAPTPTPHVPSTPTPPPAQPEPAPAQPEPAPAQPEPAPKAPPAGSVNYRSCADARAAGAAPLHRGDPGYSQKLDRDGDGIACEK